MAKVIVNNLHIVYVWLLTLLASTMCFNIDNLNISGSLIGLLSVVIIAHTILAKQKPRWILDPATILLFLFYALHVLGWLYSHNKHEAMFNLEKKLSLVIFPFLFLFAPKLDRLEIKKVLIGFVIGCTIVSLFCLVVAFKNYLRTNDTTFFYYHSLSTNAGMHAGYLAMYLCFSIAILLYINFRNVSLLSPPLKAGYLTCILLMIACIFLLSARTQLIILMFELIVYCVFFYNSHKNIFRTSLISLVIIGSLIGVALLFPGTRDRIKEAINYNNEYGLSKKWGEKQMRVLIWQSAFEAAAAQPFLGTGIGDVVDDLEEIYKKKEFISLTYFKNTRFNAHDQFLETWIGLGIVGLATFLLILIYCLRYAVRERNIMLFSILIIFAISNITESMLERQNGVVFFAFFTVILIKNNLRTKGAK